MAEFPEKPYLRQSPIALDGLLGDIENFGDFPYAQASKEPHLYYAALPGIDIG